MSRSAGGLIPEGPNLADTLQSTVDRLQQAFNASVCLLRVLPDSTLDSPEHFIHFAASLPASETTAAIPQLNVRFCDAVQDCLSQGRSLILSEPQEQLLALVQDEEPNRDRLTQIAQSMQSVLVVPLYHQHYWGSITLGQWQEPRPWSSADLALIEAIAAQCALTLTHQAAQAQQLRSLTAALDYQQALVEAHQAATMAGVLVTDRAGGVTHYNYPFKQLWNLRTTVIGWSRNQIFAHLASFLEQPEQWVERVEFLHQHAAQYSHDELILQDGRRFDCHSVPIGSSTRQRYGRLWYFRDISTTQWAETEIRNALQQQQELSRLRNRLFAMVSHEFRTPLGVILSSAELLEHYGQQWPEAKQLQHCQRIQTAVQRMSQFLDDLSFLSRGELGHLELYPEPLDLVRFCRHLIEEVRLLAAQPIEIGFNCWGTPTFVSLDRRLLHPILTNLLSNAIKYSSLGGTIEFELRFEASTVVFHIRDHGIGIPQAEQQSIFQIFHRGSNVGEIPGTGLGLAIAQHCVHLHQGHIEVESQEGQGSTFTVVLPRPHLAIANQTVE